MVITFLECVTGFVFCISLGFLFATQTIDDFKVLVALGLGLASITICCLFLGQRLAKDYAGAANLTIYFLVALFGFSFLL